QALEEKGIKAPENYYRIHLKLDFYLPLSSVESSRLDLWEAELKKPKDDKGENSKITNGQETEEKKSDSNDIPFPVLNEYRLRKELFSSLTPTENYFVGVVAVDNTGVFYIAESIISRLGDSFMEGVRSYEIEGKKLNGVPALLARRKRIAYATESDSVVLGIAPDEINAGRVELLGDILFRYFVGRRI
ncbi:MAG: hypothetical protein ABIC40_03060, partial [bacterium]